MGVYFDLDMDGASFLISKALIIVQFLLDTAVSQTKNVEKISPIEMFCLEFRFV